MKLKNKLLPLVGIGAACAAVTPIALTSCKNNAGFVNLVDEYQSKITDIPGVASYIEDDVNTIYFSQVNNNHNTFADDLYWYRSQANKIKYNNPDVSKTVEDNKNKGTAGGISATGSNDNMDVFVNKITDQAQKAAVGMNSQRYEAATDIATWIGQGTKELVAESLPDGSSLSELVYNVTVDNEKIELTNIKKETVTPVIGTSFEVWLADFTEEFDIQYDQIESDSVKVSAALMATANTATTINNKGKITFKNVPLRAFYNTGTIVTYDFTDEDEGVQAAKQLGTTKYDAFLAGLWGIGLDFRTYKLLGEDVYLTDYILESEDYNSSIKFEITNTESGVVTYPGLGSSTISNEKQIDFVLDKDFTFSDAMPYYGTVMNQSIVELGYSHYLWNIDSKD